MHTCKRQCAQTPNWNPPRGKEVQAIKLALHTHRVIHTDTCVLLPLVFRLPQNIIKHFLHYAQHFRAYKTRDFMSEPCVPCTLFEIQYLYMQYTTHPSISINIYIHMYISYWCWCRIRGNRRRASRRASFSRPPPRYLQPPCLRTDAVFACVP